MKTSVIVSIEGINGYIYTSEYKDKTEMLKQLKKLDFDEVRNIYLELDKNGI